MSTLPQDGVFGTLEDFVIALGLYERPEVQDIIITTGEYDVRSAIKWFRSLAHEANPNPLDPRKLWIDLHLKVWEMRQSSEIDEPTADKLLFLLYDIKANLAPVAHFSIDPCNLNLALPLRILTIMFCFTLVRSPSPSRSQLTHEHNHYSSPS
ncbi:hypothetical protein ONZ45_g17888 [Pleurotus djamor]|nr:hypothetical protein ONZ45_g17888 [Pleurotus djamor]